MAEYGPWVSADGLDLIYTYNVFTITRARRASRSDPFVVGVVIDLSAQTGDPFQSDDGLTLWFDKYTANGKHEVNAATRASTAVEFDGLQVQTHPELDDPLAVDTNPTVSADQRMIAFDSDRVNPGVVEDLYIATRASITDPFDPPHVIAELDSPDVNVFPDLSADGNSLMFASDRMSPGTSRIMISHRVGGVFEPPTLFDPALSAASGQDTDARLSRDGTTLVFASDRTGGAGDYDLYIAERSCL